MDRERIPEYLVKTYAPEAIITYGSYADGAANEHSDFKVAWRHRWDCRRAFFTI